MSFSLRDRKKRRTQQDSELALLRQARAGGSRAQQYQAKDDDIYDTVELDESMDRRLRQDHDDFVEDDDGGGYVDDGQDEWEREAYSDEHSEDEARGKAASKRKRGAAHSNGKALPKQKPANSIWNSYLKGASSSKPSKPTAQTSKAPADTGYLADILDTLDDIDSPITTTPTRSSAFASLNTTKQVVASPLSNNRIYRQFADVLKIKDEPKDERPALKDDTFDDEFDYDLGQDDYAEVQEEIEQPVVMTKPKPGITIKQEPRDINPFKDSTPSGTSNQGASTSTKLFKTMQDIKTKEVKEKATVIKEEVNDRKDWMDVNDELESAPVVAVDANAVQEIDLASCVEPDGSLRMYWIDACDVRGVVYVFGKVLQKTTKTYVSCCAVVKNLKRNLFVLPRKKRVNSKGEDLDQEVTMVDVYNEFDDLCRSQRISEWESKPVERKYAFEMPGIPEVADYLKVAYSYSMPQLPMDLAGETFSHVFGVNTSALEQFIIKRNLMGPCWLELKNVAPPSAGKSSWCKLEVAIDNPKDVVPIPENPSLPPPPPLCVMTLNMRTIINPKDKANEIVSVCTTVYHEVRLDDTVENNRKNVSKQTIVRKLPDRPFPPMFTSQLEQSRMQARAVPSEAALLNILLSRIMSVDPDVIVGHNFVQFDLDVLLHRMKANKTKDWSRLGRLHRTVWPKLQAGSGGASDTTAQEKQVMAGRLMCDTYIGAKEHVRAKSYGLTQLSAQLLNINREDIDYEKIGLCYNNAQELIQMLRHSDFDTYLCAELMFSLQLLPLSKQLTTLSGNLWNMTLTAGRAVRNEYLLLHEFHKAKYICPDKTFQKDGRESMLVPDADGDQAEDAQIPKKGGARRKPQYSGGLVLEPKRGFYDKFVLLLDFNSLYPSIIQEYNICFTTVKYDKRRQDDKLPEYPDPALARGILPRLLATLVERRREVKRLMKTATGAKYTEYDIRQKGLKLTANSMYGCLGAAYSRFYAKPLAMLITSRGREILQNTVDLAKENGLDVIYGDTDSIMINTNTNRIEEVRPMANNLKKIVNSRYKLLEIEMDGMYQRMLLLKKKKYAALSVTEKDGKYETAIETKGLDMVRRDWCGLSQDVSNYVLTQILSSDNQDREQVVQNIHAYLRQVADEVRRGLIPIEKYVVNKGLTKSPEDYADAKSQPHVQVALRLKSKGIIFRQGDTVPYVICTVDNAPPSKGGYADRAYHPDEVTQPGSNLTIDYEYYLNQQIHPPLDRLCGPIEGTDARRIADCLGLDPAKFRIVTTATGGRDNAPKMLESQLPDEERYKGAEPLSIRCRNCQNQFDFTGLCMEVNETKRFGLQCTRCDQVVPAASLTMQLVSTIRRYIALYYEGWLVCDDQSCRNRTRMLSVNGRQCIVEGCRGSMYPEYTDATLTKQLQYFGYLFNRKRAIDKLGFGQDEVLIRRQIEQHREMIHILRTVAERYLERDGRRFVDLSQLFSFFKISK